MGYYTRYSFETVNNDYPVSDIAKFMFKKNKESDWFYAFSRDDIANEMINDIEFDFELEGNQECKWYEHDDEMLELSRKFPDTVFKLHGEGEENGDIWDTYYKNGKMQVCQAEFVIAPYDESKLQ